MPKINEIMKWRAEIEIAEKWKQDNFGCYEKNKHEKVGELIDYFERGFSTKLTNTDSEIITTLNLIHSIVKNIVPSLYFQNPKIMATPKRMDSQDTAPIVSQILNHFYKEIEVEPVNKKIIWDAYVLGHGYYKVGYATKYGMDVPDESIKPKSIKDKALEFIGLKKKEEPEISHPEINYNIISENPYISYISPFDFGRDPRALTLEESMYWYQSFKKTVKYMKNNKMYKNTKDLKGTAPADMKFGVGKISDSEIEDFKTVDLYEIHYRANDGIYLLIISKDGSEWREHYHEKSIYEIKGWQCDELTFNKHGHNAFAISDIYKIRELQDRFTTTIDYIFEQVDRFLPKIAVNINEVTVPGRSALRDGDIGAIVECTKDPNGIFKELGFSQFKTDLRMLADQIIDFITIQTGLTKAQLLGVSGSSTATEARISQGGQTLRIFDMNSEVSRFSAKQAGKLWQIIKQFVTLEDLELINGVNGLDANGMPIYSWLTVTDEKRDSMKEGEYDFNIEVGSTQKPDLVNVRAQFENFIGIIARPEVVQMMQTQGYKLELAELAKMYMNLFPEIIQDTSKIIQKITNQTTGLVPPEQPGPGGQTAGSDFNALEKQANDNKQMVSRGSPIGA